MVSGRAAAKCNNGALSDKQNAEVCCGRRQSLPITAALRWLQSHSLLEGRWSAAQFCGCAARCCCVGAVGQCACLSHCMHDATRPHLLFPPHYTAPCCMAPCGRQRRASWGGSGMGLPSRLGRTSPAARGTDTAASCRLIHSNDCMPKGVWCMSIRQGNTLISDSLPHSNVTLACARRKALGRGGVALLARSLWHLTG